MNTTIISSIKTYIPQWIINTFFHLPKAIIANIRYGSPARQIKVIGITGTKGKSTTSHLIYHILKESKKRTILISTIAAKFGAKEIDTGLHVTTPDPFALQKLLRQAVKQKYEYAVLEVTSSGLDQFRVWGIPFEIGVFTNITPDHIDYHKTMSAYTKAKGKLLQIAKFAVINNQYKDNVVLDQLLDHSKPLTYFDAGKSALDANKNAAIAAVAILDISSNLAKKSLKTFPGVPGRFETVYKKEFQVVIDFAHTPESLQAALTVLRARVKNKGRLIALFGSAGLRDPGRRRMGEIAAKFSDFLIITAEDPRTETVENISNEIAGYAKKAGAKQYNGSLSKDAKLPPHSYAFVPDRQTAINTAINLANNGDVIGLFGKGHEQSMCYGMVEQPWSEYKAVKNALTKRFK